MRAPGVRNPEELTQEALAAIVEVIQEVLWLDMDADSQFFFNPDKEWDADTSSRIAQELARWNLNPPKRVEIP